MSIKQLLETEKKIRCLSLLQQSILLAASLHDQDESSFSDVDCIVPWYSTWGRDPRRGRETFSEGSRRPFDYLCELSNSKFQTPPNSSLFQSTNFLLRKRGDSVTGDSLLRKHDIV